MWRPWPAPPINLLSSIFASRPRWNFSPPPTPSWPACSADVFSLPPALASTTVVDFIRARKRDMSDGTSLKIARLATVAWGLVLLGIGIAARNSKSVLEAGLTIASIPFGALLGVFLLGVLTKKPGEAAAI